MIFSPLKILFFFYPLPLEKMWIIGWWWRCYDKCMCTQRLCCGAGRRETLCCLLAWPWGKPLLSRPCLSVPSCHSSPAHMPGVTWLLAGLLAPPSPLTAARGPAGRALLVHGGLRVQILACRVLGWRAVPFGGGCICGDTGWWSRQPPPAPGAVWGCGFGGGTGCGTGSVWHRGVSIAPRAPGSHAGCPYPPSPLAPLQPHVPFGGSQWRGLAPCNAASLG